MTKSPFYDYVCRICSKAYKDVDACYDHVYARHVDESEIGSTEPAAARKWVSSNIEVRRRRTQ